MKEIADFEYDLTGLPEMASLVIEQLNQRNIVLFIGEVGSGKTTLIKEICSQLQMSDEVSSPTYALV
ncbi:MAG TPA: tRNA (adenosine(37)-N6)-threonylcarbamoyltransferase complex ATPase subunit type 1 TsaE, partial [Saprospiraceae bacterium]|nr:tRNA (adenosine(37)-N6)-threonylcarbamoyltransferase complex ATPase subunit type 1 TsaE [Saprospiraceae bacterium]